jgi:hypothetical protein
MLENRDPSSVVEEAPLVCRPNKGLWALVVLAVLSGLAMIVVVAIQISRDPVASKRPDDIWVVTGFVLVFFGLPALGLAWSLLRCRMVMDDQGITFTHFFTTQFVPWQKVEDYELRLNAKQFVVKSRTGSVRVNGKWISLGVNNGDADNYDARLQRVEAQAKLSRARSWQLQEVREDGDWPKTFEYRDSSGWKLAGLSLLIPLALCALIGLLAWSSAAESGRRPDLYRVASLVVQFFTIYPLMILSQYPAIRTRRRYLGQKIVVTLQGISLWKDGQETALLWDEVESYYLQSMPGILQPERSVIEGKGGRIEFVTGASWTRTLKLIVQNRARNAKTPKWEYQHGDSTEVLGGAASFWIGSEVGVGPKVYHYRTRSIRALLLLGSVIVVAVSGVTVVANMGLLGGSPKGFSPGDLVFLGPLSVGLGFGFLRFLFAGVRCDADGLTVMNWRGKRFLAWSEVESIGKGDLGYVIKGRSASLRIWGDMADFAGLKAEIEKRTGLKWVDK